MTALENFLWFLALWYLLYQVGMLVITLIMRK